MSRRRLMGYTGGVTFSAAFLAACGGDDDTPSPGTGGASTGAATGSTGGASTGATGATGGGTGATGGTGGAQPSGLVTAPVDTSSQAKRGGVNKWVRPNEPAHLDVNIDQAPNNSLKNLVYGQLTTEKAGLGGPPTYEEVIPDLAESWEWSPDRLTLTMKLRQGVNWHNKAPVNGRPFDMEDVLFSWKRYSEIGTDRSSMVNAVNPNAPVLSFEASDDQTIVIKLTEPVFYLVNAFAFVTTGKPIMIPKETDSTFDIRSDMIGTGPYVLEEYNPTVGFKFQRNEDYWDKDHPYMDRIEAPIISEYAQALAQLISGNIYTYSEGNNTIQAEDVLPTKRSVPEILMYANEPQGVTSRTLSFGNQPPGNNPFADERVRQALSMAYDRDLFIETFGNVARYESEGLPVNTYWNTAMFAGFTGWWLDPRLSEFGENAKYFQYNPEEAKKLLDAAGYADGVDVTGAYIGGPQLGPSFQAEAEVMDGWAREVGFNIQVKVVDYVAEYIPIYRDGNGKFEGWSHRIGVPSAADATAFLTWRFHSKKGGPGFLGFDKAGLGDGSGDPDVDSMLDKARGELDTEARRKIVHDVQRHLAKTQYTITNPGVATTFLLAWPKLQNFQAFQGDRRTPNFNWWIDETKAPS